MNNLETANDSSLFNTLPIQLVFEIFNHLDIKSACSNASVCKYWKKVLSDRLLWKNYARRLGYILPRWKTHWPSFVKSRFGYTFLETRSVIGVCDKEPLFEYIFSHYFRNQIYYLYIVFQDPYKASDSMVLLVNPQLPSKSLSKSLLRQYPGHRSLIYQEKLYFKEEIDATMSNGEKLDFLELIKALKTHIIEKQHYYSYRSNDKIHMNIWAN